MWRASGDPADRVRAALAAVPLFAGLSEDAQRRIAGEAELLCVLAGSWLFRQGEDADALFVVVIGRLEVIREDGDGPRVVGAIGQGQVVGELGVIAQAPRSASVRAVRDSELVRIGSERVSWLLEEGRGFAVELTRSLTRTLQSQPRVADAPVASPRVLALAPLRHDDALEAVRQELIAALRRRGSLAVMESSGPGEQVWARRLHALEADSDHVALLCEPRGTPDGAWNAFCLRQADRVVALTAAGDQPPRDERLRGCELVLVARETPPAGVDRWRAALQPRAHHLVPPGAAGAVERAVRRILGRSVGLVLSGGGAAAMAHIGAIAALHDAGVEIDRVGGTSAGAFIGAMLAVGHSADEIAAICRRELVAGNPFRDYGLPRRSLIRGRKWGLLLQRVFGELRVEQTPLDFFALSADLASARPVVHREGELWLAVGASMSLPGLVPPRALDGRLLVDGGVLDNFPVGVMATAGEGPIVGVEAMGKPRSTYSLDDLNIVDVIARATVLGSWGRAAENRRRADVVIAPDVTGVRMFDFHRLDEMVTAGRTAAERALAEAANHAVTMAAPVGNREGRTP